MLFLRVSMIALLGLTACSHSRDMPDTDRTRVGTYDSRAIAIAFAGSEILTALHAPIEKEHSEAKDRGDQKRMAELETMMKEKQAKLHLQGFGTASVDDLLAHVRGRIPALEQENNVVAIVSKWDEATLAEYKDCEKVDLTAALAALYDPGEKQLRWIADLKGQAPVPHEEIEDHDH
jgi:hypothetical protein